MVDVSVIVPMYNTSAYVEECLISAASQKDIDVEIIVVDDCSTDGSLKRARSVAARFSNISVHQHAVNSGQAVARNTGMEIARGRYVAFLDSDDCYLDDLVLARWVAAADNFKSDVCFGHYRTKLLSNQIIDVKRFEGFYDQVSTVNNVPVLGNCRQSWEGLYSKKFLDDHNIRFSRELRQREDRLFFTEALVYADRIVAVDSPTILYRIRENSTMRTKAPRQLLMHAQSIRLQKELLDTAEAKGRDVAVVARFTTINQCVMALGYWNDFLRDGLKQMSSEHEVVVESEDPGEIVRTYFHWLAELSRPVPPVVAESAFVLTGPLEKMRDEGDMDLARIALEAERYDLLDQLLAGDRVQYFDVLELARTSTFAWAKSACMHYLRFNRGHPIKPLAPVGSTDGVLDSVERVIIHIGQPKTGTSALQTFLEEHRIDLIDRGVLYPVAGSGRERGVRRERTAGQAMFVDGLINDDLTVLGELAKEIAGQNAPIRTLVFSAENILSPRWLDDRPIDQFDPLDEVVKRVPFKNIEVVAAFRERVSWVKSFYRELAANPFNDFSESPREFIEQLWTLGLLDYDALKARLTGDPRISKVHFYDYKTIQDEGIEQIFMRMVGCEDLLEDSPSTREVNTSLSDAQAMQLMLSKSMNLPRDLREELFIAVRNNSVLKQSDFDFFAKTDLSDLAKGNRPEEMDPLSPAGTSPKADEDLSELVERATVQCGNIIPPAHLLKESVARNKAAIEDLRNAREELRNVYASRSWRITGGLRYLANTLRALRGSSTP